MEISLEGLTSGDRFWDRYPAYLGQVWDRYIKTTPKTQNPLKGTCPNLPKPPVPAPGTILQPPLGGCRNVVPLRVLSMNNLDTNRGSALSYHRPSQTIRYQTDNTACTRQGRTSPLSTRRALTKRRGISMETETATLSSTRLVEPNTQTTTQSVTFVPGQCHRRRYVTM
jgi:hypothetical protein